MTPEHGSPTPVVGVENLQPLRSENEPFAKDREEIFAEWLQQQILAHVDENLTKQDNPSAEAAAKRVYIASDEFKEKLKNWEPWRLDDTSVREDKNLYINITKGYASEHFLTWVRNKASEMEIPEDKLLAAIIETIRKIQWETIKCMTEQKVAKTYTLPYLVIGHTPQVDGYVLEKAIAQAKEGNTQTLFSKEKAIASLDNDEKKVLFMYELEQAVGRILEKRPELSPLVTEPAGVVEGSYGQNIIVIDETVIQNYFNEIPYGNIERLQNVVVEEEIHHQGYREAELNETINDAIKRLNEDDQKNPIKHLEIKQHAEQVVGIKTLCDEIKKKLPGEGILTEPFYQRIHQKS